MLALTLAAGACSTSGSAWMAEPLVPEGEVDGHSLDRAELERLEGSRPPVKSRRTMVIGEANARRDDSFDPGREGFRPTVKARGSAIKPAFDVRAIGGKLLGVFRNTYYDFPNESDFRGESSGGTVALKDAQCRTLASVPAAFYQKLCVQGSGTLQSGQTVSFAKRDCECAVVCERTSQKICFDALNRSEYPWGRGALGKPITPLLTVAVDSNLVPLGTSIYIPEYDGIPRDESGTLHDGCFVAEDRGLKVQGKHVDVFTGLASITRVWNARVPSNEGVHVFVGSKRCARAESPKPAAGW